MYNDYTIFKWLSLLTSQQKNSNFEDLGYVQLRLCRPGFQKKCFYQYALRYIVCQVWKPQWAIEIFYNNHKSRTACNKKSQSVSKITWSSQKVSVRSPKIKSSISKIPCRVLTGLALFAESLTSVECHNGKIWNKFIGSLRFNNKA